jgi:hypothetical protein
MRGGAFVSNESYQEKLKYSEKNCPSATSSTTNPNELTQDTAVKNQQLTT